MWLKSGSSSACLACSLVDPSRSRLCPGSPARCASSRPTGSPRRRRHAKLSTAADGESSHCTSSTASNTGRATQISRIALRSATAMARSSGGAPLGRASSIATQAHPPAAPGSAPSRPAARPSAGRQRPQTRAVRPPPAGSRAPNSDAAAPTPRLCNHAVVLSTTASPSSTKARGPALERLDKDATAAISRSWPTIYDRLSAITPSRPYGLKRGAGRVPGSGRTTDAWVSRRGRIYRA
jgi:hypothetical protein